MIIRIWHGYTTKQNAVLYEKLLKEEVFVGIQNKEVKGYKEIQLLRRELENEVEFTTIMWFNDLDSVREFAGEDYEKAYVPEQARKILSRFDEKSIHCELRQNLKYDV